MAIFLDQNGVLSMGNKTPVTLLQETLQKRGITPHYELLYNGTGTLDPVFKFQVSAGNLSAIGDGRTKKEAKHDAAAALLKRMQVNKALTESADIIGSEEVDIASPYTGSIKQNFVGMLDEVCVNNRMPLPVFVPIREEGPPHARVFTVQCKVSTISETAVARTKKQAKHQASQQMIKRIEEILGDRYIPLAEKSSNNDLDDAEDLYGASNLKAIECGNMKIDFSIPISNMHNAFFFKIEEFLLPKVFEDLSLESDEFYEKLENPKDFLDNVMQELGGMCKTIPFAKDSLNKALQGVNKYYESKFFFNLEDSSDEDETSYKKDCQNKLPVESELSSDDSSRNAVDSILSSSGVEKTIDLQSECCLVDKDTSTSPQCELKEFSLWDYDESSSTSSTADVPLLLDSKSSETVNSCRYHNFSLGEIKKKQYVVALSVQCLQGAWAFWGLGENNNEAINVAAIQAIKFLRMLSIPYEK